MATRIRVRFSATPPSHEPGRECGARLRVTATPEGFLTRRDAHGRTEREADLSPVARREAPKAEVAAPQPQAAEHGGSGNGKVSGMDIAMTRDGAEGSKVHYLNPGSSYAPNGETGNDTHILITRSTREITLPRDVAVDTQRLADLVLGWENGHAYDRGLISGRDSLFRDRGRPDLMSGSRIPMPKQLLNLFIDIAADKRC